MLIETQRRVRQTQVQIDTQAIEHNTRQLQALVNRPVIGVVKADAYGHGAVQSAQAMLRGGARSLAVASVGEGVRLRLAGIEAPILVLGALIGDDVLQVLSYDLTASIGDILTMRELAAAAQHAGLQARVQLQIDTGMHRLGVLIEETLALLNDSAASGLEWEGIFTHFSCADEPLRHETIEQISGFEILLEQLAAAGWRFPLVHAANSAAALAFPQTRYHAVRTGIALYGVAPGDEVPLPVTFSAAMRVSSTVVRIAELPVGKPVSYGATYRAETPRLIATVAAGYADGVRRSPAWREMLVAGRRAPVVGRVCMDATMIDITDISGVAVGDEVVILGTQGEQAIRAEEVAGWLGTAAYEVLTSFQVHC